MNVTALPFAPFWDEEKEVEMVVGGDNNTETNKTTIRYTGMDYLTLATIAQALNFTFYVIPTSSWAEVARLVEERVSFLSPVYHNMMPQRLERYDFSFVYEYGSLDFSMAQPSLKPQWQSLYYPLTEVVWAAIFLVLLLAPNLLVLITYTAWKAGSGRSITLGVSYNDMTGMLLGQNLPRRLPTNASSRVLVATWLVFAFILGSAYRGNLTASLTLPKFPPRAETLQELVNTADK
ncbi:hypothetical protein Pmani_014182 [Petrolisthes manimaculis]|uniref:Ionotropic glutamate receptor C-terminal domain-containing protein n=1 Tax=Petrolisthes manimaculis TaxID=1843537 RepID=A0AAE1U8X0_9EUCA|nr:hypothetical protein Pmani_014182 [Petrolisthes manimaculis]